MTLEDQGIHRTQEDLWEEELKQAGWRPMAAHPNSPTWRAPEGQCYPGPGFAWLVMKERAAKEAPTV